MKHTGNQSQVLNSSARIPGLHQIIWDRVNVTSVLEALQTKLIPATEQKLNDIHDKFVAYQRSRMNQGYDVSEEYPAFLLHERLKTEARLDVQREELTELQKWLENYKENDRMKTMRKCFSTV